MTDKGLLGERKDWHIDHRGDLTAATKLLRRLPILDEAIDTLGKIIAANRASPKASPLQAEPREDPPLTLTAAQVEQVMNALEGFDGKEDAADEADRKAAFEMIQDAYDVQPALGASRPSDELEQAKARHRETSEKLQRAVQREMAALDKITELEAELASRPSPADTRSDYEAAIVALRGLLVMMDESQPRKLEPSLTWRENDRHARRLAAEAIARFEAGPSPAKRQEP